MKKLISFIFSVLCISSLFAQTIDFTKDGRHYYQASPNGRYYVGTIDGGPGCFFDAETKEHFMTDSSNVTILSVNNDGDAVGSYLGFASIWHQGKEWEKLPGIYVEGVCDDEFAKGEIVSISADGSKYMVLVDISEEQSLPILYSRSKTGEWSVVKLPAPKVDEVYKMGPQFLQICGMNYDATRIFGRYLLADGKRELPFVWEQGEVLEGDKYQGWNFRFLVSKSLIKKDVNMEDILPKSDFTDVLEYEVYRMGFESGIIFDMSPFSLISYSGNGKYFPISVKMMNEEDMYDNYAAVIDVDNDSLIVFKSVPYAGTVSVNDKGEVFVYSPAVERFRFSFVVSVDKPDVATTLTEYTKAKTNGKIDLADYMMYKRLDEKMVLAEGSAVWASEGNAFVTFNYDEYNENLVPHCYMVRFDGKVDNPVVKADVTQASVFPNPTNGVLNFSNETENIVIYDITGRLVYSESAVCNMVDLSSLNAGTYVVEAEQNGHRVVSKVVIAR